MGIPAARFHARARAPAVPVAVVRSAGSRITSYADSASARQLIRLGCSARTYVTPRPEIRAAAGR